MQVLLLGWVSLSIPTAILLGLAMKDRSHRDLDAALLRLQSDAARKHEVLSLH